MQKFIHPLYNTRVYGGSKINYYNLLRINVDQQNTLSRPQKILLRVSTGFALYLDSGLGPILGPDL